MERSRFNRPGNGTAARSAGCAVASRAAHEIARLTKKFVHLPSPQRC
ncbi:hypothetical protein MGAST_15410 [Mycobacterium gastri 'Wayne']|nr:hypothetical protein MGAST_15410 [Mycobacterium gastri 'Wayne']